MDIISLLYFLIVYGLFCGVIFLLVVIVAIYLMTNRYPVIERFSEEQSYKDHSSKTTVKFPHIEDPSSISLSVVVPAYNEEERLPPMLDEAIDILENRCRKISTYKYEIIIVSDGSTDKTVEVAESYAEKYGSNKIRCLKLIKNRGKGGAVRLIAPITDKLSYFRENDHGNDHTRKVMNMKVEGYVWRGRPKKRLMDFVNDDMKRRGVSDNVERNRLKGVQSSRGSVILFADADGASKFEDFQKLEDALKSMVKYDPVAQPKDIEKCLAIAIGSRAHLQEESLAKRSIFRNLLMYGFNFLVWLFTVKDIRDTQCGFKLLTRKAAHICFNSLHVTRWAFDVELLYIAQKLNIPIAEIPVRWTEIEGSKITPVLSWIQMGCDLSLIWLKYKIGAWKIKGDKFD